MFLANEFYKTAIEANVDVWLALFVAVTTVVGVEFSGGLMCYCGVEAWQRGSKAKMWLSIIGAIVYASIMFYGFSTLSQEKAHIFGVMVLLTLVAYLGYAIYNSFETEEKMAESTITQTKLDINKINAETRRLKAEQSVRSPEQERTEGERGTIKDRIWAILSEHPEVGPREMSRTVGCSVSTASKWIGEFKK